MNMIIQIYFGQYFMPRKKKKKSSTGYLTGVFLTQITKYKI